MYAFLRPVVIIDHVVVNEEGGAASKSVLNNGGSSLNYELRHLQSVQPIGIFVAKDGKELSVVKDTGKLDNVLSTVCHVRGQHQQFHGKH